MHRALPALAVLLALTGCSASPTAAETTVGTPSSAPTPTYATENQVASVIAEYETDWRETMDEAGGCRFDWTMSPGSITGFACYLNEQTMSTTSELVLLDLDALDIPPSMTALVADTTAVLQLIVDKDLKGNCGEAEEPADTQECTDTLGGLNFLYNTLEGRLDAWKPYL
jgi:hypothetical protein